MSSLSPGPVPCAIASNHGGWQGVAVLPLCTSLQVRCRCGNTRMNVTLHYDLVTILMTMHRCDSATVAIRCRTVRIRPDCQVSDLLLIRCNHDHHCNINTVAFIHSLQCVRCMRINYMTSIHAFDHSFNASMSCDQCSE